MAESVGATATLAKIQRLDVRLSVAAVAQVSGPRALRFLLALSRFGDWALSAVTGGVLGALAGPESLARFAVCTGAGLVVQKSLKRAFGRVRPCLVDGGPVQRAPIPDPGSFPSGHTLHAVLAAGAVTAVHTPLAVVYVPLALLMGMSRVVLGVHYPSDVAAGAVLGAALAAAFTVI